MSTRAQSKGTRKTAKEATPPHKGRYILAIDQGTTGTTVNLVHVKGETVARVNEEYRQIFPKPGWVEHRPDDIWKSVLHTIDLCLKKARVKGNDIAAIGITNQRETVVLWDRKTMKPSYNAIVWQDRRTAADCDQWKRDGAADMLREETGLVIDPYFSASKIRWMLNHVPGLRARAESGQIAAGTIDTYLLWRLTGGDVHKTDVSNASRTQLMNIRTGEWDPELLKFFEVPSGLLPEICDSSGLFGETRGLKILPDGIPITGVAGDQQAALFGQTCFEEGESKCTFGTGSFLLINSGHRMVHSKAGLLTTAAWRLRGQPMTYALEGGAFVCGAAVQFLRDQLGFIKTSQEIEKLASQVKSSEGVEFVPALAGLGAPHWDPFARGLICGLTRGTTRAHIARATLEAMALQNTEILLAMKTDLGQAALKSVRADGGAAANGLLMQLQADYLGADVVRPKMIETTSAGAAYLAGLGAGLFNDLSEIKKIWKIDRTYRPQMNEIDRGERLNRWRTAVRRTGDQS